MKKKNTTNKSVKEERVRDFINQKFISDFHKEDKIRSAPIDEKKINPCNNNNNTTVYSKYKTLLKNMIHNKSKERKSDSKNKINIK